MQTVDVDRRRRWQPRSPRSAPSARPTIADATRRPAPSSRVRTPRRHDHQRRRAARPDAAQHHRRGLRPRGDQPSARHLHLRTGRRGALPRAGRGRPTDPRRLARRPAGELRPDRVLGVEGRDRRHDAHVGGRARRRSASRSTPLVPTALTRMVATIPGLGELVDRRSRRGEPVPEQLRRSRASARPTTSRRSSSTSPRPHSVRPSPVRPSPSVGTASRCGPTPVRCRSSCGPGDGTSTASRTSSPARSRHQLQEYKPAPLDFQ